MECQYRLLAHQFLPDHLEKILYLDADILCINDAVELYQMEMGDYPYAAASHTHLTNVTNVINKIRLKTYEAEGYYLTTMSANQRSMKQRV